MSVRTSLAFILIFAAAASAAADPPAAPSVPRTYTRFTTNDGLAQNMTFAVHLDKRGFLWIATKNGLSKYDGYTFHNYEHDPSDSTSISSGYVMAIHECPSGDLWIGLSGGNVDIFHRRVERFEHLNTSSLFPPTEQQQFAGSIVEDGEGTHWYSLGARGVMEVKPSSDPREEFRRAFTVHRRLTNGTDTLDCPNGAALFVDHAGRLWAQTFDGTVVLHAAPGQHHPFPSFHDYVPREPANFVLMHEDSAGVLWSAVHNLLFSYNPATGATRVVPLNLPDVPGRGIAPIFGIEGDGSGKFFILTPAYIARVDPSNPAHPEIIPPPEVMWVTQGALYVCFTVDRSGAIWLGTSGYGLFRYDGRADRFGMVPGITWTAAVWKLSREVGPPPHFTAPLSPYRDLFWSTSIRARDGSVWTDHGIGDLVRYGTTGTAQPFRLPLDAFTGRSSWFGGFGGLSMFALEDRSGSLWIARMALSRFDAARAAFVNYQIQRDSVVPSTGTTDDETASIIAAASDPDGTFWFGTIGNGLYRFDPSTLALRRFVFDPADTSTLSENHVLAIRADPLDPGRYLWIGTEGGGLNRLDKETGRFLRITERQGLPNNVVYAILADRSGDLWMSTNQGLARLDPRTMTFRNYDVSDGLRAMEFNREQWFQDTAGTMYFGNLEGINIFDPARIADNSHVPPIVLTEIRLRNVPLSVRDPHPLLAVPIAEAEEISVPYDQNVIALEFAALDFANPGKNRYSHMLEGFEREWSPASTRRTVSYTNLDPGRYTFRVRGSNSDGVWNMTGASLVIEILPPWYRTFWAKAAYVLLAFGGLVLFRRYDLRRIRLKDQLKFEQERTTQLQEVDRLKMRFFQNVSHEFRTPLTLILGPVEKMLGGAEDHGQQRDLRVIRRNARRLLDLINQILDISKLEAGGMTLRASEGDLVPFVRGIAMAFHSLAERKGIFLDVHSDVEALPAWFERDKLEKVLVNLIGNAFKFTPERGEIIVSVSAAGPEAVISVRDTGIGIPADKLPHIFHRFYQVDGSSTRAAEGTGIGLSLVKDFVELHKGRTAVESEPGKGTEFKVFLPLGKSHLHPSQIAAAPPESAERRPDDDAEIEGAEAGEGAEAPGGGGRPIVLVVEDNADVRAYIRSCLAPRFAVAEAVDGAAGVTAAGETIPDLVISDVMMPKMDGYDLCASLKRNEKTSHIPVILLTAKAAREDKIGGLETGADDYLVKPFDAGELLARVNNLIDMRRKLREKFGREIVALKPDEVRVAPREEAFLRKAMAAVEARLGDETFSVDDFASALAMSYTQLHRKLKAVTDQSAAQFIRKMRLKRAMELLRQRGGTVSEIAYSVGFGSPAYFTKCFQEEFGRAPSEILQG